MREYWINVYNHPAMTMGDACKSRMQAIAFAARAIPVLYRIHVKLKDHVRAD